MPGPRHAPGLKMNGRSQRSGRQMALWTRSRSTCLRATSKGSTAVIALASHAYVPAVHAAALRPAVACDVTSGPTSRGTRLIPLARNLALADPAQRGLGLGRGLPRRKVLAITPGAAGAVVVVAIPAGDADHKTSSISKTGHGPKVRGPPQELTRLRAQAALARRIRRRRSAARSSSFSPPQTPYFSGRDKA
jgi:hypothetical protein